MNKELTEFTGNDVATIIVTYNPDVPKLERLIDRLASQVEKIIIIDNGSTNDFNFSRLEEISEMIKLIRLERNFGISVAQNIGINIAIKDGDINFVLLSDQDSEPVFDMVYQLLKTARNLIDTGRNVAAVGPCYIDTRQKNPPPFLKVDGLKLKRQYQPASETYVEVDYLIASGCLIPVKTLKEVGMMNEEMFIDYVDIEWGLRAKVKGFQSFGDYNARMEHNLGEAPVVFRGKSYPLHSPLRHYYMMRNAVWLYKQSYIPLSWKMVDGYKLFLKFGFYSLFARPRVKHFLMMLKGLFHGTISRMGPA